MWIEFDELDVENDPAFSHVFTPEGDEVVCPHCGQEMMLEFYEKYVCPYCRLEMTREEFMNYIGVDPEEDPDSYNDRFRYP